MNKHSYCYIVTNQPNGTLYVGVTTDLVKRVGQHQSGEVEGFTSQHGLNQLVWFEEHGDIESAIRREKNIKAWKRAWKIRLIEENNPDWFDLYPSICQ